MIQLNLLPDLKKDYIKAQKTKSLVISVSILVTLGAVGLSVLLFIYVTFVQQLQINLATDDIKRKAQELRDVPDIEKYLSVQNQLSALPQLHDQKGSYGRLLDFLGSLSPGAPNNVALNNLQVLTPDSSIVFNGTTNTFESMNVFVDTLKNAQVTFKAGGQGEEVTQPMFKQVLVQSSGLTRIEGKLVVTFSVKTVYRPEVFEIRNTDMKVKVPNITTTPSVNLTPGSGEQLFDSSTVEGQ